jgi:hypothetical protein
MIAVSITPQGARKVQAMPLPVRERKAVPALAGVAAAVRARAQIPPIRAIVAARFVMAFPSVRTAAEYGCAY